MLTAVQTFHNHLENCHKNEKIIYILLTSTIIPGTVVTINDKTLRETRTVESENSEISFYNLIVAPQPPDAQNPLIQALSAVFKPDTRSKSRMKADMRRVLKVSWLITKVKQILWKYKKMPQNLKYKTVLKKCTRT